MAGNLPIDVALLLILAVFICAIIFFTETYLSFKRLLLLLILSLGVLSFIPAARVTMGPGPAIDQNGEWIRGQHGELLYDAAARNHWLRADAAQDAIIILAVMVAVISMILILIRLIWVSRQCYHGVHDK